MSFNSLNFFNFFNSLKNQKMKKAFLFLAAAGLLAGCAATDKAPVQKTLNQEEVMSKMSLEDKAHFVIGTGMAGFSGNDAVIGATRSLVPGAAGTTYPLDSLGIPAIVLADGPAGLRIDATRGVTLPPITAHTSPSAPCLPLPGTPSSWRRLVKLSAKR